MPCLARRGRIRAAQMVVLGFFLTSARPALGAEQSAQAPAVTFADLQTRLAGGVITGWVVDRSLAKLVGGNQDFVTEDFTTVALAGFVGVLAGSRGQKHELYRRAPAHLSQVVMVPIVAAGHQGLSAVIRF